MAAVRSVVIYIEVDIARERVGGRVLTFTAARGFSINPLTAPAKFPAARAIQ